ncbi:DUF4229 domain-containing protein [Georgenia sp. EYE_87]|uniref:DUF4229 domain-containing protein n=1 Tax=Georgenia sp. EYE_87 TaxID=2853448 RepID=UPI0020049EED|nr:DUF4229 domain-containing protein [Georgenia sp. EYE_87]MCK6209796.1 DUF4229 domain-containing protein [Georgenia sp. EYE_87]
MRLLVYTLLRLGLVLAAAGVLYLVGLRSWVLWIAAVVVGALLSFLLLGRQREDAASVLAQYDPLREERPAFSPKVQQDADYEDAVVDAAEPGAAGGDVTAEHDPGVDAANPRSASDELPGATAGVPGEGAREESAEPGPTSAGTGRPGEDAGRPERPAEGR